MSTSDELEGVILAYTVAEAAHIKLLEGVYGSEGHGPHVHVTKEYWSDGVMIRNSRMVPYRPDRDIVQAIELVRQLWNGQHPRQHNGGDPVASVVTIILTDTIPQEVEVIVFSPTLADVHVVAPDLCTAICRAYLKVVGTE